MLKQDTNALFKIVQESGLSANDFERKASPLPDSDFMATTFKHVPSGLTFTVLEEKGTTREFVRAYTKYTGRPNDAAGVPPNVRPIKFPRLEEQFRFWMENEVVTAIEEEFIPDLWEQAKSVGLQAESEQDDYTSFTNDEREQVKMAVETFRSMIVENFDATTQQLAVVNRRLDYLSKAVDKSNRFDWKALAVSTILQLALDLALDHEKGRTLFGYFLVATQGIRHLMRLIVS